MKLRSKLLLVKVDPPKNKDADGIFMADEWKSLPPTGTITQIAEDVTFAKVGERIFFERYAAIDTPWENIRLCREDNILGVLDEKD